MITNRSPRVSIPPYFTFPYCHHHFNTTMKFLSLLFAVVVTYSQPISKLVGECQPCNYFPGAGQPAAVCAGGLTCADVNPQLPDAGGICKAAQGSLKACCSAGKRVPCVVGECERCGNYMGSLPSPICGSGFVCADFDPRLPDAGGKCANKNNVRNGKSTIKCPEKPKCSLLCLPNQVADFVSCQCKPRPQCSLQCLPNQIADFDACQCKPNSGLAECQPCGYFNPSQPPVKCASGLVCADIDSLLPDAGGICHKVTNVKDGKSSIMCPAPPQCLVICKPNQLIDVLGCKCVDKPCNIACPIGQALDSSSCTCKPQVACSLLCKPGQVADFNLCKCINRP